jgi:serine/threonine-protein kinase RsbW
MVHTHRPAPGTSDRAGIWSRTGWPVPRRDHWQRLFRGQQTELRQLRHWLTGLLPDTSARDDLISVAVELGTNAIQHTASGDGGWFTVEVSCLDPVFRVAVTDEGAPGAPRLARDPLSDCDLDLDLDLDCDIDRGRGLLIVRALSVTSGVCGNARGRTVWAEVAAPQSRSSSPSASSVLASSRTL